MPDGDRVCVICGESCAGQPRTKDPQGRYYHRSCHEQALAKTQRDEAPSAPIDESPVGADMLSELLGGDAAGECSAMQFPCPTCGQPVEGGASICTHCGRDVHSTEAAPIVQTHVKERVHRDPISHLYVGGASMVIGVPGAAFFGWMLIETVMLKPWELDRKTALMTLGAMSFLMFFSIWLLVAGFGVLRWHLFSYHMLLRWGIFALVVAVPFFVVLLTIGATELETRRVRSGATLEGIDLSTIVTVATVGMGASALWPIVVLTWGFWPSTREMVKHWALK